MRLKLEVFEKQKCNISTDRAQRKDEQNKVIHLVMFTPSFRVIKMSKNGSVYVPTAEYSKNQFGENP